MLAIGCLNSAVEVTCLIARPEQIIQVRRDNIFEDAFNQLSGKPLAPHSAGDSRPEEHMPLMYQEMDLSPSRVRRY